MQNKIHRQNPNILYIKNIIQNNIVTVNSQEVLLQIVKNDLIEILNGTIPIVRKYFAEASLSLDYNEDLNTVFLVVNLPDNGESEEEFMRIVEEDFKKYREFLKEYFTRFRNPNFTVSIKHV